jgi:hypothetical protein
LLNGETVHQKIQEGQLIARELQAGKTPDQIVEELYIRSLCRRPTDQEKLNVMTILAEQPDPTRALEDVFWALLNSREFIFNH